jgi:hypothetical protein
MKMIRAARLLVGLAAIGAASSTAAIGQPAESPTALRSQVVRGGVFIVPGDHLTVDLQDIAAPQILATRQQGKISDPTKLPADQITIHMASAPPKPGGTILMVQSGLKTHLRYHAMLMTRRADGKLDGHPTTICAIKPGLAGIEHWPETPVAIMITSFEATTASDGACKL